MCESFLSFFACLGLVLTQWAFLSLTNVHFDSLGCFRSQQKGNRESTRCNCGLYCPGCGGWPADRPGRCRGRAALLLPHSPHRAQVSCDWATAGHVTTILVSDWLTFDHPPCAGPRTSTTTCGGTGGCSSCSSERSYLLLSVIL